MLRSLHRDIHGKVNALHIVTVLLVAAGVYALVMYYPPYIQFMKIRSAAREMAQTASAGSANDERQKSWFDNELDAIGVEYPTSRDIVYHRYGPDKVQVSFEYEYEVAHPLVGPHVLHFTFRCVANNGVCGES
jgi:hypothetical protein